VRVRRFAVPVIIGGIALALWSAARAAPVDFWTLGAINNNPGRLIRGNEIIPRFNEWLSLLGNITGFPVLLGFALIPLVQARGRHLYRESVIDLALGAMVIAMLLGYWLIAFNTYDRYLLPLGPLLLLLAASGVTSLTTPSRRWPAYAVIVCVLPFTLTALRGELAVGGDRGQHSGIDRLAEALNKLPANSTVYQYWLDWELDYYLGDQTTVKLVFQPAPEGLARSVCLSAAPSYLAVASSDALMWLYPFVQRGGRVSLMADGRFRLYRLDCTF
jgi:hypothetical protein